jgi:hypothetical protein
MDKLADLAMQVRTSAEPLPQAQTSGVFFLHDLMKDSEKKTAKALPPSEWRFYELSEREAKLAFWYEYGRESEEVKNEVAKMRASQLSQHPQVWHYAPHDHRLYKVISAFAQLNPFPQENFLTLKEKAIAAVVQKRAQGIRETEQIRTGTHPLLKVPIGCTILMPTKSPDDPVETLEWMAEARLNMVDFRPTISFPNFVNFGDHKAVQAWREAKSRTVVVPPEMEKFIPRPEFSALEWMINWNMPDAELISYFEDALTRGRPARFKELASKPKVQLSFDGAFPFRRGAALQWLGVYRRRKTLPSWAEFFAIYPDENVDKRKGKSTAQSSHSQRKVREDSGGRLALDENRLRAREEDFRKVKLILQWFDWGLSLKKQDFK